MNQRHGVPACAQADRSRSVQEDADDQSSLERFLTVFHDFDEQLLSMVQSADASTVTEHGLYERPVSSIPEEVTCTSIAQTWMEGYGDPGRCACGCVGRRAGAAAW